MVLAMVLATSLSPKAGVEAGFPLKNVWELQVLSNTTAEWNGSPILSRTSGGGFPICHGKSWTGSKKAMALSCTSRPLVQMARDSQ